MVVARHARADANEPAADPATNAIRPGPSAADNRPAAPRAEVEAERFIVHEILHFVTLLRSTERILMSNDLRQSSKSMS
jgi:hypothetical protein